ncbi:hypothetical protein DY000_02023757 [Brassica cretica]|uniref:ADP-ribosyl cyclase/cyclic ADP-ribose hydrolase n=1 Tax=Brassica cretica TaxID=69181 RepID=A0ABQ7E7X8_BRACR|nr:hypothetical protein DY000_02023757 [Brassica cretica]
MELGESSGQTRERWSYDVFLSFRGPDVRRTFLDHLYTSLVRSGIYAFRDDNELARGRSISPELLKAIQTSKIHLVVLSNRAMLHHLGALKATRDKLYSQFSTMLTHHMSADKLDYLVNLFITTISVIQRVRCSSGRKL